MRVSALIRGDVLSLILGGALWMISNLWELLVEELALGHEPFSEIAASGSFIWTAGLSLIGALLLLFGLMGLNLHQREVAGSILGGVGFLVAFFGTALVVGAFWNRFFVVPSIAVEHPAYLDTETAAWTLYAGDFLSFLVLAVGWALFGVCALTAQLYPRWLAIVLIIGALLHLVPVNGNGLVFGVAIALLGYYTLVGRGGRPSSARR